MSIGSAFDAFLKSHLHKVLFGGTDPRFELEAIFEEQVESHNRDWAKVHGEYVFNFYRECGALADLHLSKARMKLNWVSSLREAS